MSVLDDDRIRILNPKTEIGTDASCSSASALEGARDHEHLPCELLFHTIVSL